MAAVLVSVTFKTLSIKRSLKQWKVVRDAFQEMYVRRKMKLKASDYAVIMPLAKGLYQIE
jgi:hypothetical protein